MQEHKRDFRIFPSGAKKIQTDGIRLVKIVLGSILMALSMNLFMVHANLLPGGFNGLTVLIQRIFLESFNMNIPFAALNLALNVIPASLAFFYVGKKFFVFSIFGTILFSLLIDILPVIKLTDDVILNATFGALMHGYGLSLALNANSSFGGTDFIAMIFSNRYNMSLWNYILVFNALILSVSGYLFGWDSALYSVLFQAMVTFLLNKLHTRYKKRSIVIITDEPEPLCTELMRLTHHGITSFEGIGRYSGKKRVMLYMVVSHEDIPVIQKFLRDTKHEIFMNIFDSKQLTGRFYLPPLE